jgi:hypothetical protein
MWSYKQDKLSGDVLPVLKPGFDHIICDSARYALEPIIRAGKPGKKQVAEQKKRRDYGDHKQAPAGWKVV